MENTDDLWLIMGDIMTENYGLEIDRSTVWTLLNRENECASFVCDLLNMRISFILEHFCAGVLSHLYRND